VGGTAARSVLVTGGAAGLGRAHALRFGREGWNVILADIDPAGMNETKAQVEALEGFAECHVCDMSREADIVALGEAVVTRYPGLDVLINNAGLHAGEIARGFLGLGMEKWQRFYAVNVIAPLLLAEAVRPALKAAKGLIINTSSMAAYRPETAYGITKASLNLFTHAMASQFAADEIRSLAIAPGLMETPNAKAAVEGANWERLTAMQQVKRQGTPQDIANLAFFLASEEGSFINNEVVHCDGGNSMRGFRI
jgi:3-oxoacyl-[acyl-carrier protein] reductase